MQNANSDVLDLWETTMRRPILVALLLAALTNAPLAAEPVTKGWLDRSPVDWLTELWQSLPLTSSLASDPIDQDERGGAIDPLGEPQNSGSSFLKRGGAIDPLGPPSLGETRHSVDGSCQSGNRPAPEPGEAPSTSE